MEKRERKWERELAKATLFAASSFQWHIPLNFFSLQPLNLLNIHLFILFFSLSYCSLPLLILLLLDIRSQLFLCAHTRGIKASSSSASLWIFNDFHSVSITIFAWCVCVNVCRHGWMNLDIMWVDFLAENHRRILSLTCEGEKHWKRFHDFFFFICGWMEMFNKKKVSNWKWLWGAGK